MISLAISGRLKSFKRALTAKYEMPLAENRKGWPILSMSGGSLRFVVLT
jgi:hypothetical protein